VTPRVVLDSNVIVSGLGWSGPPARIVDAALEGQCTLLTSEPILVELRRVLAYPKLAKAIDDAERLVDLVAASGEVIQTSSALAVVDDESDNRVLEAAIAEALDP
jgi:putative PIN family toxin of toxin-antitoxin system